LFSVGNAIDTTARWETLTASTKGAFGNDGAVSLDTTRDGTSNTFAIGESRQRHTSTSYGPYWGWGCHTSVSGRALSSDVRYTPNYKYDKCSSSSSAYCQYAWGFGSYHPGITNFLMLDGSVRPVQDSISNTVYMAAVTPIGGEAVNLP
jgi:prepilin-type processing-associated H-X9-DG protein